VIAPLAQPSWAIRREIWLLVGYGLLNLVLLVALRPAPNADWATAWWNVANWGSDVYDHPWRYSPVMLPVVQIMVAAGPWALAAAHLIALAALARMGFWPLWLFALSAFFWVDLIVGNVFTFVAVAAAFAISGSRAGSLLYMGLTLLMPRPVQVPLALWLLWRRPDLRMPTALLFGLHALGVLASGLAWPWMQSLVGSTSLTFEPFSVGPGRVLGLYWLLIGVPAAALMVWRGSAAVAALAGVVASPFLLPQYLLMAVIAAPPLAAQVAHHRKAEPTHHPR
jgi:hypothetical protein